MSTPLRNTPTDSGSVPGGKAESAISNTIVIGLPAVAFGAVMFAPKPSAVYPPVVDPPEFLVIVMPPALGSVTVTISGLPEVGLVPGGSVETVLPPPPPLGLTVNDTVFVEVESA